MFERLVSKFSDVVAKRFMAWMVRKLETDVECRSAVMAELGMTEVELEDMLAAMKEDANPY